MRPGEADRIAFWPNELRTSAAWCGRSEGGRACAARCVRAGVGWAELHFGQTNFASARTLADLRQSPWGVPCSGFFTASILFFLRFLGFLP